MLCNPEENGPVDVVGHILSPPDLVFTTRISMNNRPSAFRFNLSQSANFLSCVSCVSVKMSKVVTCKSWISEVRDLTRTFRRFSFWESC